MKRRIEALCSAFLLLWVFVLALQAQQATAASPSVPLLIRYSGIATDAQGKHPTGTVGATFALYKDEQGGAALWVETQNVTADSSGHYTVQLGASTSTGLPAELFTSGEARWLGVSLNGQAEQPRVLLLSVPYALKALDAQTIGGLPPSAFVLAAPANSQPSSDASSASTSNSSLNPPVLGGSGKPNYLPIWTKSTTLGSSVLFQSGTGAKAKIGIGTAQPASTLDVKGSGTIRGLFTLPASGTATATAGFNSQPMDLTASVFNSGTSTAVPQTFQWQSEPVGNNTSNASGSLNLLFAQGTGKPAETGLNIASNGQITFASGQTFPGAGTVMSVGTGLGLTGGPVTSTGTLSIDTSVVPQLGTGNSFTGNQTVKGNVSASQLISTATTGTTPLQVTSTTQVPNLNASFLGGFPASAFQAAGSYATLGANTFSGTQTVNSGDVNVRSGNLDLAHTTGAGTGTITLDSARFIHACCSISAENTFVGVDAGNFTGTGSGNTATGFAALSSNSTGYSNTASGANALSFDTTGNSNTASGASALDLNTTGSNNTADGVLALSSNSTGSHNTADGSGALTFNTTGNDNTGSGFAALASNTTGIANAAIGGQALVNNTTGSWNTAGGDWALFYNSTGSSNVALGYAAGNTTNSQATTGSSNTFVGANSGPGTQTALSNATAIGANASATASNALVLGSIAGVNGATASVNVGIGTTAPASTLDVHGTGNFTGFVSFAAGQTFPGTGTVTSVGSGAGLTGGPITGSGSLSIAAGGVTNAMLANSSLTINPGTDLLGGGSVSLGGTTTLNLDTNKVPQLAAANTFTGNQTVNGNLSATGVVTGSVFNIGSNMFAFGSFANNNAFMGFAGNPTVTGTYNTGSGESALGGDTSGEHNTATGALALQSNTTGSLNTAIGFTTLSHNTTGSNNTATGDAALTSNIGDASGNGSNNTANGLDALYFNTVGNSNTAIGVSALQSNTTGNYNSAVGDLAGFPDDFHGDGSYNTFVGSLTRAGTGSLTNGTAIGAQAEVDQSNALVLGSINGVNGSTSDTTVGIGTTTPVSSGLSDGSTTTLNVVGNNTYVPLVVQSPSTFGTWMLLNNTSSGGKNWAIFSAASGNTEGAGNLGITNFTGSSTIYLEGNVHVTGNLSKGGGSFKIDHPLDPANKYLYHSFVESPDMMNIYNGNIVTDKRGLAMVTLPDYFGALNRDFRYQLTVIGQFAQAIVLKKLNSNRFTIKTSKPGVEVSWQVTGIRQDAYANAHRIPVEENKPPQEQGHYLHPELFGASSDLAIGLRSAAKGIEKR